jgi:hypothetical protein
MPRGISAECSGRQTVPIKVSTRGSLGVSTLEPLSHVGSYCMPATERFLDGVLPWVTEDLLVHTATEKPM